MPSRPHIAFDRLHVTLGWPKLAPRWPHETPSWHQDRPSCAQVGPKMGEVGPKTVQSRTDMAPGGLKFASSWPQDCIKADISQTCIKPTNSFGKTMIFRFPHAQFASKMAQDRSKIRSKSTPSRSEPDPIRSNPVQSDPNPDPDRSMATPGRIRMVTPGRESPEIIATHPNANRLVYPLVNPSV